MQTKFAFALSLVIALAACSERGPDKSKAAKPAAPPAAAPAPSPPASAPPTAPAPATAAVPAVQTPAPGSDRDPHGCIPSAGYVWCATTNQCERPWELANKHDFDNSEESFNKFCANPSKPAASGS
jgi:hypothetical protein